MKTLKGIGIFLVAILGAIGAGLMFFFKKPSDNNPSVQFKIDAIGATIQAHQEAIKSEEELRDQIKKDTQDKLNEKVSENGVVDFFNTRPS